MKRQNKGRRVCGFAQKYLPFVVMSLAVMALGEAAYALPVPAQGQLGYDVYDMVVNKGLNGPIGNSIVVLGGVGGAGLLFKQQIMPAAMAIGGGAVIGKMPSIVNSMGATLDLLY